MKNIHAIIVCVHLLVANGQGEEGTMKQKYFFAAPIPLVASNFTR